MSDFEASCYRRIKTMKPVANAVSEPTGQWGHGPAFGTCARDRAGHRTWMGNGAPNN
jgi:hypothetical protein